MTKSELIQMVIDWIEENVEEMENAESDADWEYYHGRVDFADDLKPYLEKLLEVVSEMKISWIETYADTLMGGNAVDRGLGGDNTISVGIEESELEKLIADLTEYKSLNDFYSNYDCDDSDDIIHYMQDHGGTIYYNDDEESVEYRLMKTWNNWNLKIELYKER